MPLTTSDAVSCTVVKILSAGEGDGLGDGDGLGLGDGDGAGAGELSRISVRSETKSFSSGVQSPPLALNAALISACTSDSERAAGAGDGEGEGLGSLLGLELGSGSPTARRSNCQLINGLYKE